MCVCVYVLEAPCGKVNFVNWFVSLSGWISHSFIVLWMAILTYWKGFKAISLYCESTLSNCWLVYKRIKFNVIGWRRKWKGGEKERTWSLSSIMVNFSTSNADRRQMIIFNTVYLQIKLCDFLWKMCDHSFHCPIQFIFFKACSFFIHDFFHLLI